jgi:hypothetical protein
VVRSEVGDGEGGVDGVVEEGSGAVEEEGEERRGELVAVDGVRACGLVEFLAAP